MCVCLCLSARVRGGGGKNWLMGSHRHGLAAESVSSPKRKESIIEKDWSWINLIALHD